MPFFSSSKSRSSFEASSMNSSASLLIPQEKQPSSSQKDYSAAFGALASQYGAQPASFASSQPASAIHVSLPVSSSSQSQSQSKPASNVKKVRAKEFGALQNKYGAIGYGGMTSII